MANPAVVKGGRSLNPVGRPKGFAGVARMIMDSTRDGAELVEWALSIWRDVTAPIDHRWQAFMWLSDRGMGKPMAMVDLHVSEPRTARDLTLLTEEDLEDIDRRFRIAHAKPKVIDVPSV